MANILDHVIDIGFSDSSPSPTLFMSSVLAGTKQSPTLIIFGIFQPIRAREILGRYNNVFYFFAVNPLEQILVEYVIVEAVFYHSVSSHPLNFLTQTWIFYRYG